MYSQFKFFDYLKEENVSDQDFLSGLLDYLMHVKRISGYSCVFVPQMGPRQGEPVLLQRYRRSVPEPVREEISKKRDSFNISVVSKRVLSTIRSHEKFVSELSISNFYDINIGAIWIVSEIRISFSEYNFIFNFFENIVSFRKKAVALSYPMKFLSLDQDSREELDSRIGSIVNDAIAPNQTILFCKSEVDESYIISYTSKTTSFVVPAKRGPIGYAFESRKPVIINNTKDVHAIKKAYGESFTNPEFINHNEYNSLVYYPVSRGNTCYCVIACYFARVNAVSITEKEVIDRFSQLLGDYYKIWYDSKKLSDREREGEKIFGYVRQSLLIADIMHDATEDLVTANGQLGLLSGKNDAERLAISAAKDSLKSVIRAARHFRSTFSGGRTTDIASTIDSIAEDETYEEVGLRKIASDIGEKYNSIMRQNKIEYTIRIPGSLKIQGIRYNVRRAIDNAVKNAISHLHSKTHVKRVIVVSAEFVRHADFNGRVLRLRIEDNGDGISPDNIDRVKLPFVSLRGGMGLGLPIIEAACNSHGGKMELKSDWGKGCVVTMLLPAER